MTDENNLYKGRGKIIEAGTPTVREPLRRPGNNDAGPGARSSLSTGSASTSFKGLSADAPEFIPRSAITVPHEQLSQLHVSDVNGEGEYGTSESLEQVRTIIYEMSVDPGEFDTLAHYLTDALNASVTDENILVACVHEIFEQSMVDSNLRYNGSRLCNYLSNNLTVSFEEKSFRYYLITRCNLEFNNKQKYATSAEGRKRLRDFAMLMGELFIHLEVVIDKVSHKVSILGASLPELLDTLLKHSTPEDVKCVCQILKFTGAAMEDLESCVPKLNDLFDVMKALASQESIERSSKDMLVNVIKLKEINWGRATSTSSPESTPTSQLPTTDPIFYGPDGVPISSEETRFLESDRFLYNDEDYNENEFGGQNTHFWSPADGIDDQMDDEMAEDYEKFLLENS